MKRRATIGLLLLMSATMLRADELVPGKPGPKDKCPVCGMFVARYPDWVAAVIFADGTTVFFDGVKDLMKYCFNLARYAPGRAISDIQSVQVTDYYRLEPIEGRRAFYVWGSDVYGPMGKELIPFEKEAHAREFMKDHQGKDVLPFERIDPPLVKSLD